MDTDQEAPVADKDVPQTGNAKTGSDIFRIKNLSADFFKPEKNPDSGKCFGGAGVGKPEVDDVIVDRKAAAVDDVTDKTEQPSTSLDFALKRGRHELETWQVPN